MTDEPTLWDAQPTLPETPYAGTSGWSGSDTSLARVIDDDTSGRTSQRQADTLASLRDAGDTGLTWKELGDIHGWHHGKASGALSVMHKTGRIARLTEKRNRCKVYVHPDHVNDRHTEPHGGSMTTGHGNLPEANMLTERQADILIDGQRVLVGQVARTLETCEGITPKAAAERVIDTIAGWLSDYRPGELGSEYIGPLDLTAFILRKGEVLDGR